MLAQGERACAMETLEHRALQKVRRARLASPAREDSEQTEDGPENGARDPYRERRDQTLDPIPAHSLRSPRHLLAAPERADVQGLVGCSGVQVRP